MKNHILELNTVECNVIEALHHIAAAVKSFTHFMRNPILALLACDITAEQRNDGKKQRPSASEHHGGLVVTWGLAIEQGVMALIYLTTPIYKHFAALDCVWRLCAQPGGRDERFAIEITDLADRVNKDK
ncbi:hypothetical protein GGX14DRAFT_401271 [Mycena pura]|uniref:Uncharacterized protein n=1 Tax=Mycena pura TaxID=153505 RepID=A0AAD6V1C6_9AGAR|nr:hypothetical protein GGX14DRAFT_401271 [Mycena pura]